MALQGVDVRVRQGGMQNQVLRVRFANHVSTMDEALEEMKRALAATEAGLEL